MASALRDATFVGCDLSSRAIASARAAAIELALTNITFLQQDFSTLPADLGSFDYIIAHGIYSWVPPEVRDALFDVAARHLAPQGVMFVSYNVYPGCHVRKAAWEAVHHHVDAIVDPHARLDAARAMAALLAEPGMTQEKSDALLRDEFRRMSQQSDSALFHDDLAEPNDPVYFHQFAAHAASRGLAFLAEAKLLMMSSAGNAGAACPAVRRTRGSPVARAVPGFRARAALSAVAAMPCVVGRQPRPECGPRSRHACECFEHARACRCRRPAFWNRTRRYRRHGDRTGAASRTAAVAARALSTNRIAARSRDVDHPLLRRAPIGDRIFDGVDVARRLREMGTIELYVEAPAIEEAAAIEQPLAASSARWQARKGLTVTNLRHETMTLQDGVALDLLALLDGTRTRDQLASQLSPALGSATSAEREARIDDYLRQFTRYALLMPRPH